MTPERWQRVKELFEAASALDAADQPAWLMDACGEDEDLFRETLSLLSMQASGEAIIDKPAAAYLDPELLGEPTQRMIGQRIGAYEIVALLGHGGMGAVYRAKRIDAEFDKQVAIKLVPGGHHAQYVLQRLRSERQILATLDHPGIARLIDGGATDEGLPYLIMELIEGEAIDLYCERRDLSQLDRLALFRQVCAAVTYAHQRLVVHRDLKPGNILVTADGTVKLLDFGIAKLLQPEDSDSAAAPTVTQMRALTPGYSSPEQILGRPITTASDVYSLGVLLYLLLTGHSPYRGRLTSTQDAIREVVESEPTRPNLTPDLEAITLRALRKEPERRYATVEQFSEDVRRFIDGLPVIAQGDQFSYRAAKFLRRHKLTLAAASLVTLALISASVISWRQARIAEAERARAERHFASVRRLADVFMFQMHDAIKDLPGSTEARSLLLKTALEYLNTLSQEANQDPGLQFDLANAYQKVADIQGRSSSANTGESEAAIESYGHAIALLEPLVRSEPDNLQAQFALGRNLFERGQLYLFLGKTAEAKSSAARGVAILEALVKRDTRRATRRELANGYVALGFIDGQTGDAANALIDTEKGNRLLESLANEEPDDLETLANLSASLSGLAQIIAAGGDVERAIGVTLRALKIDQRLVDATAGNNYHYTRSLLADYINLCNEHFDAGKYVQAATYCRAAAPISEKLSADRSNVQSQIDHGTFRWNLGKTLLAANQDEAARATFHENIEALTPIEKNSDTLVVQYTLAASEQAMGTLESRQAQRSGIDRTESARHWKAAVEWYERALPRFAIVQKSVSLDRSDIKPVKDAQVGLERARAALSKQ